MSAVRYEYFYTSDIVDIYFQIEFLKHTKTKIIPKYTANYF